MDDTGFNIKQNWLDVNNHYALTLVSKK